MSADFCKRLEAVLVKLVLICLLLLALVQGLMLHEGVRQRISLIDSVEGEPLTMPNQRSFIP